jgi:hypothetical protein
VLVDTAAAPKDTGAGHPPAAALRSETVDTLRRMLRARNLDARGNKDALVERIIRGSN